MTEQIRLTKGFFAIIDDEDYLEIASHDWCYVNGYARRTPSKGSPSIFMHRIIINAPDNLEVDHINHNTLDNRRTNLRICTHAENSRNRKRSRVNSSGFIGVSWRKDIGRWVALIRVNNQSHVLGCFDDPIEAARVHDQKAIELCGEFASLNFPSEPSRP